MDNNFKLGMDIISIKRIESIMETRKDPFLKKIFTERERAYIEKRNYRVDTVAGIFSAKEAVSKALGSGIGFINWKDIEILHDKKGKPYVNKNNKLRKFMKKLGLADFEISISHEREFAIALAISQERSDTEEFPISIEFKKSLLKRKNDSHKGHYGRVGVIAGSIGMTGASYLTSQAALRAGSGLVYTLTPKLLYNIMSIKLTEAIIKPIEDMGKGHFIKSSLNQILKEIKNMDAIAIGPGLGVDEDRLYVLQELIRHYKKPIVLDADAINCLSLNPKILINRDSPIIITPHPGELGRLMGVSVEEVQKSRKHYSKMASEKYNLVVALKGSNTVVTGPDEDFYINNNGNPGMATAGSGDVLTGIILSFIGQGLNILDATKLGVFIHGLSGDIAASSRGQYGLIASDILESIPISIKKLNLRED